MSDFLHTDGIVKTATRYRKMYPDWTKKQALEIAISEYDCWSQIDEKRYAVLMALFEQE